MSSVRLATWLLALSVAALGGQGLRAQAPGSIDPTIHAAYRAAYNLDLADAATSLREAVRLQPGNPRAHRALATVLWLTILFERGAVTIDHYIAGISSKRFSLPPPSPPLAAEFQQALKRAIALSEAQLAKDEGDLDARDELGKAYALQASYIASIEGSMAGALRAARRAFDAQETILERDPRRVDAGVIVGLYRYVVSTMALPSRLFAYVMGMGGGKERGISLLEQAAQPPHTLVEAEAALVLIFAKEKRHLEGLEIMRQLAAEYPRNRIFVLEVGAAALRAERYADADATLTRGLAAFDVDPRPKIPGERALWLYKRGQARLGMKQPAAAAADFEGGLASGPVAWVEGRLHVGLGKVHDLAGRRAEAVAQYEIGRRIAEQINDPASAADAARLLQAPFRN